MAEYSGISWTTHTQNFWRGCDEVSPGCDNCYAREMSKRNHSVLGKWGDKWEGGTRVIAAEQQWQNPKRWDAEQGAKLADWRERLGHWKRTGGRGPRPAPPPPVYVFSNSLADLFESWGGPVSTSSGDVLIRPHLDGENKPENWEPCDPQMFKEDPQSSKLVTLADVRHRAFEVILGTPNLRWLLLTKRPENINRMLGDMPMPGYTGMAAGSMHTAVSYGQPHVMMGTTVENQHYASRLSHLAGTPFLRRFVSCEPLLGPLNLMSYLGAVRSPLRLAASGDSFREMNLVPKPQFDWLIVGGESHQTRSQAREFRTEWAEDLLRQCSWAGVPFFMKQTGDRPTEHSSGRGIVPLMNRKTGEPLLAAKGGKPEEWPEHLRVQEFPPQPEESE